MSNKKSSEVASDKRSGKGKKLALKKDVLKVLSEQDLREVVGAGYSGCKATEIMQSAPTR